MRSRSAFLQCRALASIQAQVTSGFILPYRSDLLYFSFFFSHPSLIVVESVEGRRGSVRRWLPSCSVGPLPVSKLRSPLVPFFLIEVTCCNFFLFLHPTLIVVEGIEGIEGVEGVEGRCG